MQSGSYTKRLKSNSKDKPSSYRVFLNMNNAPLHSFYLSFIGSNGNSAIDINYYILANIRCNLLIFRRLNAFAVI